MLSRFTQTRNWEALHFNSPLGLAYARNLRIRTVSDEAGGQNVHIPGLRTFF